MNITKLPSGSYRIRENVNGITYSKTIKYKPKKYEAEQIIADMIGTGETHVSNMTVREAIQRYIDAKEGSLSPSTVRGYNSYQNQYPVSLLNSKISDLTEEKIQLAVSQMSKGKSKKYMTNIASLLHSALRMFRKKFVYDVTITQGNDSQPKREDYQPVDSDVEKLLDAIKGTKYDIPIKLAMLSMRRSEICGITLDDVGDCCITVNHVLVQDKDNNWVYKSTEKNGERARVVYIPKALEEEIREQGYIYKGHPQSIYNYLQHTLERLGMSRFPLHRLRHYYASKAHALNIPKAYIKKNGGWKSDTVLNRVYTHAQTDMEDEITAPIKDYFENIMVK